MTVLYIHGFASSGNTSKVAQLRDILGEDILAPSLTHNPGPDMKMLMDLVRNNHIKTVVGSSLGGFYAILLGEYFDLRLILINPSLEPHKTLVDKLGTVQIYGSDSTFEWTEQDLEMLSWAAEDVNKSLTPGQSNQTWPNILCLLSAKDERLDAKATAEVFSMSHVIIDPDQDHRFSDLSKYADQIRRIANAPSFAGESDQIEE